MGLPPGLGVPQSLKQKFRRANQAGRPYQPLPANQYGPSVKTIGKGSLVHFNYMFWIHDPQPLIQTFEFGFVRHRYLLEMGGNYVFVKTHNHLEESQGSLSQK